MKKIIKKISKKLIPGVIIKNLVGMKKAVSYYPDYVFGGGEIRKLKSVDIEVTFKCNCRCLMCPLYGVQTEGGKELLELIKEKDELSSSEFEILFKDLKQIGVESVNFTGGEAFLREDILTLIKMAKENGFVLSITSTASVLKEETARKIVEYGLDCLTISLDGPKEVHEHVRQTKIYDKIMRTVDIIKEEKSRLNKETPNISFLCTVSALNQKTLVDLVRVCKQKEISLIIDPIIFTNEETLQNTKTQASSDNFSKKESFLLPEDIVGVDVHALVDELHEVKKLSKELNQPVYISIDGDEEIKRFFADPEYSVVNKCFAPWYSLRIDPYGTVYPCSISTQMGNIRENKISEIINNNEYVKFRCNLKENKLLPFCKKCCLLYSPQKYWNYLPKV